MPTAPPRPCNKPGCKELITKGSYCKQHATALAQAYDKARGNSNQRGYNARWHRERKQYLKLNPECVRCKSLGLMTPAKVVDHITPHRGGMIAFWDKGNWQSLCFNCHNSWKQSQEKGG